MDGLHDLLVGLDVRLMIFLNVAIHNPVFNRVMPVFDNDHAWRIPLAFVWLALMIFAVQSLGIYQWQKPEEN